MTLAMKMVILSLLVTVPASAQEHDERFSIGGLKFGDSDEAVRSKIGKEYVYRDYNFQDPDIKIVVAFKPNDAFLVEFLAGKAFYVNRQTLFIGEGNQTNKDDLRSRLLKKFGKPSMVYFSPGISSSWVYSPDSSGPLSKFNENCLDSGRADIVDIKDMPSLIYPIKANAGCGPLVTVLGVTAIGNNSLIGSLGLTMYDTAVLFRHLQENQQELIAKQNKATEDSKAVKPPL